MFLAGCPGGDRAYWDTTAGTMVGGPRRVGPGDHPKLVAATTTATPRSPRGRLSANAEFLTGSGSISVNGNPSVNNITFDAGTGYTLGGAGTLTLSGSITANQAATIGCILGGIGIVKGGSAQLNWNSTGNTTTGTVEVTGGTLNVAAPGFGALAYSTTATGELASRPGQGLTMGCRNQRRQLCRQRRPTELEAANYGFDASDCSLFTMTGGTITSGYIRADGTTTGVIVNSSTGGSVISSVVAMVSTSGA